MVPQTALEPIPQPPGHLIVGNLSELRGETPMLNLVELAKTYGPIFRLDLRGRSLIALSSCELVNEVCDDHRFDKFPGPAVTQARLVVGDGLLTAWTHERNWKKAHNILTPSFGSMAIRSYLPEMGDIATQLVDKWSRLNPDQDIDVSAEMTRLTLDTIGLCAFSYRFNSFYSERAHPFIAAMIDGLAILTENMSMPKIQRKLMFGRQRRLSEAISATNAVVDQLIAARQADPEQNKYTDLLQAMLTGVDRESGQRLDPINVRYQILTFLVAGHETTSGLLSFTLYALLKNPNVLAKAYTEVDAVLGDSPAPPSEDQVRQLHYISQILNESLRLWPPALMFTRHARQELALGGRYLVKPDEMLLIQVYALHRDKAIWGPDPEQFDPSHFDPPAVKDRPANAFRPFGTGMRACIGRHFALQEATLALAMILQRFELVDHTHYELKLKQGLFLKPDNFRLKVRPRPKRPARPRTAAPAPVPVHTEHEAAHAPAISAGMPLLVLYGSNTGACEAIAHRIAEDATLRGFAAQVEELDARVGKLPTTGAVIIVTASYNGTPTDNAAKFVAWVNSDKLPPDAFAGVRFTVFGCGDHDWAETFQRIPRLIDAKLAAHGGERIHPRGEGDQSDDIDTQFRGWYDGLFDALARMIGAPPAVPGDFVKGHRYEVEVLEPSDAPETLVAEFGARPMVVLENRELQIKDGARPSERSTRHIVFRVPEGLSYREGDHLAVLPRNAPSQVARVLARFGLPERAQVRIRHNGVGKSFLPADRPIDVNLLLSGYLAIQDPARRSDIEVLADYAEAPAERAQLAALAGDDPAAIARYRDDVLARNRSLIDLLEDFPSCKLPFNLFVELVPILKPRYFSISSSPLVSAAEASITVGVVEGPARSGHGLYRGVASAYLSALAKGDEAECFIHAPSIAFFPPADATTPMIMIGAGTGVAPFRGFLQARVAMKARGDKVGPALLFHGCRNPAHDHIYADEFTAMARAGVVELEPAYSRPETGVKCYVQHRLAERRDRVWQLIEQGGVVYVCGDASTMAPAVEQAFLAIGRDKRGVADDSAKIWLAKLKADGRYLVDIWPKG
jgi:cytochrome P450 / NADPH-cytochrome P450 reductase